MTSPRRRRRKRHDLAGRTADLAWEAVERGDLDRALKEISRAIGQADDSPAVWTDYGRILALAGRLREAERALRDAVRIGPKHADARAYLAEVLAEKGLTIEAYRQLRYAVSLRPGVPLWNELLAAYERRLPGGVRPDEIGPPEDVEAD